MQEPQRLYPRIEGFRKFTDTPFFLRSDGLDWWMAACMIRGVLRLRVTGAMVKGTNGCTEWVCPGELKFRGRGVILCGCHPAHGDCQYSNEVYRKPRHGDAVAWSSRYRPHAHWGLYTKCTERFSLEERTCLLYHGRDGVGCD